MMVTMWELTMMVTRELMPGLMSTQLLRAALLTHCAGAARGPALETD